MMKQFKYLIIGNSTAAAGAIDGIRSLDSSGGICVLSREKCAAYSRPLISYMLEGRTDPERMRLRSDKSDAENGVTRLIGAEAVSIDPKTSTVVLDNGERLGYGALLAATGSIPFTPPMDGLELVKKRFSFMTLDDASSLEKTVEPTTRVLVLGGGLIGLKCAEALAPRAAELTVVDLAGRILSSVLDEESAEPVQRVLEAHGVRFRLGVSAKSFTENTALLSDGTTVEFDVLVTAVGVRAETKLVRDAGGETARGVVTDTHMRTSLPNVYAAGDCAEVYDASTDSRRVLAVLPNAYRGGHAAGVNMAGGEEELTDAIPINASGFFGLHIATAGAYSGECLTIRGAGTLKKLYYGGRLNGFIMVGDIDRAGVYASLVRSRTPLSQLNRELLFDSPTLAAFPKDYRDEKLAERRAAI